MPIHPRGFASDNCSGVHPAIFSALSQVNENHYTSYGDDPITTETYQIFKNLFGDQTKAFFVFNGTAANVLALKSITKPYSGVLISATSHIWESESTAPETFTGCRFVPVPSVSGKISVESLAPIIKRRGDPHYPQMSAVSITQPTEYGTIYSLAEIKKLSEFCKANNLALHMDGARFTNAVQALGVDFKEATKGVDVLSFGGTKNGLLYGEAVVFLNPNFGGDFQFIRKLGMQLPSKMRFVSAQLRAFLKNNLWKEIAAHSNQMAKLLETKVRSIPGVEITQPVQTNVVFAKLPQGVFKKLREQFYFYEWDEFTHELRWMTTWDTNASDIEAFAAELSRLIR